MKFKNTEVWGFEHAIRGMRNPFESWNKSDSFLCSGGDNFRDCKSDCGKCQRKNEYDFERDVYCIGKNDLALMQKLIKGGSEHRKFMRQIFVSVDISAPIFWWKEFDTYKIGTVANSTSTMHTIMKKPITIDNFEMDDFDDFDVIIIDTKEDSTFKKEVWDVTIRNLNRLRDKYLATNDKKYWKELIRLLPESWLQTRTITMNYENLLAMCSKGQRRFHKLSEWSGSFIAWARTLPYAQELLFLDELENKDE